MALTRDFRETVLDRARTDPKFREALLKEGINAMLAGDVDAGRAVLRDYIDATIGFEELGGCTNKPAESLMHMFGPMGDPQTNNFFEVIGHMQRHEGVQLRVLAVR